MATSTTTRTRATAPPTKAAVLSKATVPAPRPAEPPTPAQVQLQGFERGVRLYSEQRWADAVAALREVASGPAIHVADRARGYLQVCERRLAGAAALQLNTADDHFNYAVERLNARDFEKARHHLASALKMQPKGDHILYTLALSCGLTGDGNGAYENLKRAIEVEPRNRLHARQDSDFAALAERFPELRNLLEV
ncbi:MAG: Tetratricopeptide 2 repeat protein [Bryobacterales bacterium]|jgi:tetratricopeptide (TPR) repeat protein|nr:Tetratricopeptide 2 repeat protein [Bryobacterales bacterium]